jgi:ATPase subunit of ABC transporter with duplicated ATPase domains
LQHEEEAASRHSHLLDARVRQEDDARKAIAAMHAAARDSKGGRNDKVLKQAKQKQEKMARIGLFREDGRRFKLQSLSTLDDDALRLPEKVEAVRGARDDRFEFPAPDEGGALRSVNDPHCPLVEFREAALGFSGASPIIAGLTQQICLGSRIAVVGSNGAGKTTLLRSIVGEIPLISGSGVRVPGLRIAYVSQLCEFTPEVLRLSPAAHLQALFSVSEVEARSRLGRFGISGSTAMMPMALLSGGQRVRVSFAQVTWNYPHLIVLDEPTNHLDIGALRALGAALGDFKGAVVLVSHNASFCCSFCHDLWIVKKGTVCCRRGQDVPFPELFGEYAASLSRSSAAAVSRARAERIHRAEAPMKTAPKKETGGIARSSLF